MPATELAPPLLRAEAWGLVRDCRWGGGKCGAPRGCDHPGATAALVFNLKWNFPAFRGPLTAQKFTACSQPLNFLWGSSPPLCCRWVTSRGCGTPPVSCLSHLVI